MSKEARLTYLWVDVGRQVDANDDAFEPIAEQQALGKSSRAREVHDAALEALIDEIRIDGIACGQAGWQPPHLQVERGQLRCVAIARPEGIRARHGIEERALEVDLQSIPTIGHVQVHERFRAAQVLGRVWCGCRGKDVGILRGQAQAVDMRDRQHVSRQDVRWRDCAIGIDLNESALEQLDTLAQQRELIRNGVAEGAHTARLLEVVQDGRRGDAVARGGEEARVGARNSLLSCGQRGLPQHTADKQRGGQGPAQRPALESSDGGPDQATAPFQWRHSSKKSTGATRTSKRVLCLGILLGRKGSTLAGNSLAFPAEPEKKFLCVRSARLQRGQLSSSSTMGY